MSSLGLKLDGNTIQKMFLTDNLRFETLDHTRVIGVQDQWRAFVRTLMNFRFPYVNEIL
jgi:hypothetical protein